MPLVRHAEAFDPFDGPTPGAAASSSSAPGPFAAAASAAAAPPAAQVVADLEHMPRADLVLVFPCKPSLMVRGSGDNQRGEEAPGLRPPTDSERHLMEAWQVRRQATVASLSDTGLILMPFFSRGRDKVFVKAAADEQLLRQAAEANGHRLELRPQYLSAFAAYKSDYAGRREWNYSDRRVSSHLYKVHNDDDDEDGEEKDPERDALRCSPPPPPSIFRTSDRIRLIDHVVRSNDHDCAGVDVGQLIHDGELFDYFPLHENKKLMNLDQDWFKAFAWGASIDKVRNYFGERVAMYFLFASHLNHWLIPAALLGLVFIVLDLILSWGSADNVTALPLCAGVCAWASTFGHFWRRSAAMHALRWGTLGHRRSAEPTRPEFFGVSRVNPVTGRIDRHYPWNERIWKVLFSYAVLSVSLLVLLIALSVLFALRHVFAKSGGRLSFQVINAVVVDIMNGVLGSIARRLTDLENHRAQSEYAYHLLAKTVVFKFVNCYASLYYIAFFKEHSELFGMPMACAGDDCLADLASQLAVFLVVRLALQNFVELGVPYLLVWYRNAADGHSMHSAAFLKTSAAAPLDLSKAERESAREEHDLCEDMDEVLLLYGYTTLFAVACPWVPILALISSLVQCFLDQKKLVLLYRRPFPVPAANNEPWDTAFDVMGILAVITNAALAVFASDAYDDWTNSHRVFLFIAVEHWAVFVRLVAMFFWPAVPRWVELRRQQQDALVHRHFDLGGEEDDPDTRAGALAGLLGSQLAPAPFIHASGEKGEEAESW